MTPGFNQLSERTTHSALTTPDAPQFKPSGGISSGASAGFPVFLKHMRVYPRLVNTAQNDPLESEARQAAGAADSQLPVTVSPASRVSSSPHGFFQQPGSGSSLPGGARQVMEDRFGSDFSHVRIHDDPDAHRLANSLGANALTSGSDIFFNQGKYAPESSAGQSLLAHELTHVVQQGGQPGPPQFDLMMTLPTAPGSADYFEIEMATRPAPRPGMQGDIRFFPDPNGPYSAQIGLVQVVNVTDQAARTTPTAGDPVDWSNVGTGAESARNTIRTTGAGTAPAGWFVDVNSAANPQSTNIGPNYIEHWISPAPHNQFGWLRSPTDWGFASLYDYPWFSFDVDFEFETVAKATDTQAIYGALEWGFGIRSGVVQNEYAHATPAQSAVFDEALERFRGYYTHEPLVLYFDTNNDIPIAGEENKIRDVLPYLGRYPDVMLEIDGYADEVGNTTDNNNLSQRRADNVQDLCLMMGIDQSRIDWSVGWGETNSNAAGASAGALRANRRVTITFRRTASSLITP